MVNPVTDKQYRSYDRLSRYATFPIYYNSEDNKYLYGLTAYLKDTDTAYVAHKVVEQDTLDSLALYYYNNSLYYWIIADFNRIRDPYAALKVGSVLKIPTFNNIRFDI